MSGWHQTENISCKVNSCCFKFHRSHSISFNVKCLAKFSGVKSEGPYLSLEKDNFCVVLTYFVKRLHEIRKFHVAAMQRRLRNVQKSVMDVQSCCLADINLLLFFQFFLPSPGSLLKLPIVAIQKFCYHGNVTSPFSSLLMASIYWDRINVHLSKPQLEIN